MRYVPAKNTATILHNNLVEKQGDYYVSGHDIYTTVAIQRLEEFTTRDYERPAVDGVSGMLPPKLARIMINLARRDSASTLLDPFCGSGTILGEAALMGYKNIIGSDVSERAIDDTKKNILWLKEKYHIPSIKHHLIHSDIRDLSANIDHDSIDVIVTEPYLGKPLRGNEDESFIRKQAQSLSDLYIKTFRTFKTLLKSNGVAVCIIPSFTFKHTWINVDCIEDIKKLGFTPTPLLEDRLYLRYHRPQQHLARDIWRFEKR